MSPAIGHGRRVKLLLIADTHVPRRARTLPDEVWAAVDAADVVVHAGDWVDESLVDELEARAKRLVGVYGNNDGPAIRARLPEVARVELDGLRLGVVHETGSVDRPREALRRRPPRPRRPRLRAQPHPVGHHDAARDAAAQPGLADRPSPSAAPHLPDRDRARRGADRRHPAPALIRATLRVHVTARAAVSSQVREGQPTQEGDGNAGFRGRRNRGHRSAAGTGARGARPSGDRDDVQPGQAGLAGEDGRRRGRDGRAGRGIGR